TQRRGAVQQAERISLRAGREKRDPELVHHVGLIGSEVQGAPERARRGVEGFLLPCDETQTEVRLPDLRIEREDPLESGAYVGQPCAVDRERRATGALEVRFEVGALQAEPQAMRLGEGVAL